MTKLLHTRSKIFFPYPYVLRIEYEKSLPMEAASKDYRQLLRRAYRLLHGTWGYCHLEYEEIILKDDNLSSGTIVQPLLGSAFPVFLGTFNLNRSHAIRGYACFQDTDDALQFRLMTGEKATRVHMWPDTRLFTIHELKEDNL